MTETTNEIVFFCLGIFAAKGLHSIAEAVVQLDEVKKETPPSSLVILLSALEKSTPLMPIITLSRLL